MQDTVYKFQKNSTEEVRIGTEEYKGVQCIDLRVFLVSPLGSQSGTPTAKGLKLRVEQLPELATGIDKLRNALGKGKSGK